MQAVCLGVHKTSSIRGPTQKLFIYQKWLASPSPLRHYPCPSRRVACDDDNNSCRAHSRETAVSDGQLQVPTRDPQAGLILPKGPPGSWDEAAVGTPVVQCYVGDNEERWFMWYSGRAVEADVADVLLPSAGNIGVAVSGDGVWWQRGSGALRGLRGEGQDEDVGLVLGGSEDWWTFDTRSVAVSDVQILSNNAVSGGVGVYWMMYTGGSYEEVAAPAGLAGLEAGQPVEGLRMCVGLCMSQDGRHWARIEGEHSNWAMLDVGEAGEWDGGAVAGGKLVAAGPGDMRLYYYAWDEGKEKFVVGLARSRDGFRWQRHGPIFEGGTQAADFDFGGAAAPHVVRDLDSRQFLMWYEAVAGNGVRSVGLAVSPDGVGRWQRHPAPVLAPSGAPGAWDGGGVGAPCAVQMAGSRWRLYYGGKEGSGVGPWQGVGLAVCGEGGERFMGAPTQFRRRGSQKE